MPFTDKYVPKELRSRALFLAARKLAGDRHREARSFVRSHRRSREELEAFVERMTALPDVQRDAASFRSVLSDTQVARMRQERAGGTRLSDLASRYGVSLSTVSRVCGTADAAGGDG